MHKKYCIVLLLLFLALPFSALAAPALPPTAASDLEWKDQSLEQVASDLTTAFGLRFLPTPEAASQKISLTIAAGTPLPTLLSLLEQQNIGSQQCPNGILLFGNTYLEHSFMRQNSLASHYSVKSSEALSAPKNFNDYRAPLPLHTEEYTYSVDQRFQEVLAVPVSTFSADVDTASYTNVRRFLNKGSLPPPDAVRTEELINFFDYHYQRPNDGSPLRIHAEAGSCPWNPGHQLIQIALQARDLPLAHMPPSNLVFLIDVSGSMDTPDKLPLLKAAFSLLVKQLRPADRVAIVVYAGQAGLVLESTPGDQKPRILDALNRLSAGGSTAGGEGIQLAYKTAKQHFLPQGNNRVILATDGDFNVGVSSEGELVRLIEKERQSGIFLSLIGLGTGNIKDNKMEQLADKGNGTYSYLDSLQEAQRLFVSQLAGSLYTVAKDVKIQVEFNPAQVKYYRLIGYENRQLDRQDFKDDAKDAGDIGAGQSVTALYEIIPAGSLEEPGDTEKLVFQKTQPIPSNDLLQIKVRYKLPDAQTSSLLEQRLSPASYTDSPSESFRFASAVAEYGLLLRQSPWKGKADFKQILTLAQNAKTHDPDGYRREFIRLVEISQLLSAG